MTLKFQVQLKIRKPVAEVFDAVVNGDKLTAYFVQTSSGPLAEGAIVKWKFAEAPDAVDVVVLQVVEDESIVFEWPAASGGYSTRVAFAFAALDERTTMVQISESGWREDPPSVAASYGNAGGWMHMMCCLKAFLEYGVNLRAGGAR
jgi:uncharacterized protein YndB with AHSA1/START domain